MPKSKPPPLVNWGVLRRLEHEFDDPAPVRSFVQDFVTYWDERYLRLEDAVRRGDTAASFDALLSVRIAATMIGASRLARLTAEQESMLKYGEFASVAEALPELGSCGTATVSALVTKYLKSDSGSAF